MHRIALLALVALPPAIAFALVTPACGDACEDLAPVCDRCTDTSTRASCERTVDDNVQDVCSGLAAEYERDCPEVFTVASSTGPGGTTVTASSASTGTGGQGGSTGGQGGTPSTGGTGGTGGN